MRKELLIEQLMKYGDADYYPFHMPGHKRNQKFFELQSSFLKKGTEGHLFRKDQTIFDILKWDITELDDFDNLHEAKGILKESMERLSSLYKTKRSFYSINGSTAGILAGIRAMVKRGDQILVARNCHTAVYHALELMDLRPIYLMPMWMKNTGILGSVNPEEVDSLLKQYPDCKAVVITSPTYEGVVSDIASIANIVHSYGIPLLVDEAHGAHLGFDQNFPDTAVHKGADIIVQSFHKTLPSVTQTAVVHVCGDKIDPDRVAQELRIFETSSPSYLFLACMDWCVELLQENGKELFSIYADKLHQFYKEMEKLKVFSVYQPFLEQKEAACFSFDPGKILIGTKKSGQGGAAIYDRLCQNYHLVLEMKARDYVLGMTSICDTEEGMRRLTQALLELDASFPSSLKKKGEDKGISLFSEPFLTKKFPEQKIPLGQARERVREGKTKWVSLEEAIGHPCASYLYLYPPGIPLVTLGELLEKEWILWIKEIAQAGLILHGKIDIEKNRILILKIL